MAEAVIGSIAGKIIANLVPQALEKLGNLRGVKRELEVLRDTVSMLWAVLDDAEEQYHHSRQIQVWLEKLKDAFFDAQDVLEEFNVEAMQQELRGHNKMMKEMSYKVRAVREKIEAINTDRRFHLDERPVNPGERDWGKREETHSFILKGDIIGRDDDKKMVMEFLLDLDAEEHVSILPIVGIGGLGKTAIAQCVHNDEMVTKYFDLKMWVCVSNDFDVKKIVKNIIACAKKKEPTEVAMEQLQSELRGEIDGKRYLLVLDDLWNANRETWVSLKSLLVGGARGSKIFITTRLPLVAEITSIALPYLLKGLSESASLDLLMQMACRREEKIQDLDMLAIGKEIVRKCSGDYKIKKFTLIDLWVAEGFIWPSNRIQHLEDIAHGYFKDLLWSNFFQDFQKYPDTNEETCKMHDLMHDLTCLVAGTECWVVGTSTKSISKRTRHISYGLAFDFNGELPISCLNACALRTLLSVMQESTYLERKQRDPMSEAYLRQLIQSFKSLRILDLHDINVIKVPRSICKLKHLTYLDLSHNKALKRLPNSITRLQHLQTLNLYCCYGLKELPRGQLSSLHRLTRFILSKEEALAHNYCELGELNGLNNIQGSLAIENLEHVTDAIAESRAANLIGKHSLESLELLWGYLNIDDAGNGDRDEVILDGLRPHSDLQNLTICGYKGESFPKWMMNSLVFSLPNLVEVRLRQCRRCKWLPQLGQLPCLKTLEISGLTELESIMSLIYPKMKTTSWICKDLRENGTLQSLQQLEIIQCPLLTSLPEGVQRLASLSHLTIAACPNLEERCKRDAGEDWYKIAHIPHITP
ncbi:hypothetical protein BT93_B0626 [Corymbia citriodora subsp. variegata]|nr:hypothetical protein BT93_B0626 [Corymbia citriodora subsp. variegata]